MLFSHEKEGTPAVCDNVDELKDFVLLGHGRT